MNAQPTPGPWRDEAVTSDHAERMRGPLPQDFLVVGSDMTCIGVLYDYAGRVEANARLIAAAPELLDMLQQYNETVAAGEPCFFCATSPHLRLCGLAELIAKAEGNQP